MFNFTFSNTYFTSKWFLKKFLFDKMIKIRLWAANIIDACKSKLLCLTAEVYNWAENISLLMLSIIVMMARTIKQNVDSGPQLCLTMHHGFVCRISGHAFIFNSKQVMTSFVFVTLIRCFGRKKMLIFNVANLLFHCACCYSLQR